MTIYRRRLATYFRHLAYLCTALLLLSVQLAALPAQAATPVVPPPAPAAMSQADRDAIYQWPLWNPNAGGCNSAAALTTVSVTGNTNIQIAYNFFVSNGYSPMQAAGIVGNLDEESIGVNPTQGQIGGGGGYGIAQWTPPTSMFLWINAKNGDAYTLGGQTGKAIGQLDYLLYDLNNGNTAARDAVKADTTVATATYDFMHLYERPAAATAALNVRTLDANAIFAKYGNSSPSSSSGGSGSCTSSAAGAQGCVNPFSKFTGLSPERIDMGVDYAAPAGSPILAMCSAKILGAAIGGTGWVSPTNTQGGVYLLLTGGPYAGKTYFVAEDIRPTVKTGDTVTAGQEIATFLPSPTGIETGWGSGTPYGPLAAKLNQECFNGDPGCWSSAAGVSFNKFLIATGAKSGIFVPGAPKQTMPPGYP